MKTHHLLLSLTLAPVVFVTGCGDDGTSFEGIYSVTSWTRNEVSCAEEGPSVLADESQTNFYVKNDAFFGEKFVALSFCDDQSACEASAGESNLIDLGGFIFDQGDDDNGWVAESFFGFVNASDLCDGTFSRAHMTGHATGVRVEIIRTEVTDVPQDSDDFCDFDKAREKADSAPCGSVEAFAADEIAPLP